MDAFLPRNNNNVQYIFKCSDTERYLVYTSRSQWKKKTCKSLPFSERMYKYMSGEIEEYKILEQFPLRGIIIKEFPFIIYFKRLNIE